LLCSDFDKYDELQENEEDDIIKIKIRPLSNESSHVHVFKAYLSWHVLNNRFNDDDTSWQISEKRETTGLQDDTLRTPLISSYSFLIFLHIHFLYNCQIIIKFILNEWITWNIAGIW